MGDLLALQGENQGVGNGRFVFDNQDMRHGVRARQGCGRTVPQASHPVNQQSGLSAVNRRAGFTAAPNSRNALAPISNG